MIYRALHGMQTSGIQKRDTFHMLFFHTINITTKTKNVMMTISQTIATPASNIMLDIVMILSILHIPVNKGGCKRNTSVEPK